MNVKGTISFGDFANIIGMFIFELSLNILKQVNFEQTFYLRYW